MQSDFSVPEPCGAQTWFSQNLKNVLILFFLLAIAVSLRLPFLGQSGYVLDEIWAAEICSGHGSAHRDFPVNQILSPPDLFDLKTGTEWWNVWSRIEITHPPLYFALMRLWMSAIGEGDAKERLFSVLSSLAAIAFLFDVVRLKNTRNIAFWACLLMIVAPFQIEYSRRTRNYAFAFLTMLMAMDALVRIEKFGLNRRRLVGLVLGVLATGLSHYFTIGWILAMATYAAVFFKGRKRVLTVLMFVIAGAIYLVVWAPFFYRQIGLFSVDDSATNFVKDNAPGHVLRVINLLLLVPAKMLVPRYQLNECAYAGALFYILPFVWKRRCRDIFLWGFLLIGSVGVTALLDLSRSSLHLGFARYISFAGPAVFVLVPALSSALTRLMWLRHALPAAAVMLCLCYVNDAYTDPAADPKQIVRMVKLAIGPNDVVVFASRGNMGWTRGVQAMMLIRYLRPIPCSILFLEGHPPQRVYEELVKAHSVVMFTSVDPPSDFLPGFKESASTSFPSWGTVSVLFPG